MSTALYPRPDHEQPRGVGVAGVAGVVGSVGGVGGGGTAVVVVRNR